jgi:hypothetical protein
MSNSTYTEAEIAAAELALCTLADQCEADCSATKRLTNDSIIQRHYTSEGIAQIVSDYLLWAMRHHGRVSPEFFRAQCERMRACLHITHPQTPSHVQIH